MARPRGGAWRESWEHAPPNSWGRPIGALKARILADDWAGAEADAHWALELGAATAQSPIGRYAGALALLALGRNEEARPVANSLHGVDGFPEDVADALRMLAAATTRSAISTPSRACSSRSRTARPISRTCPSRTR